MAPLPAWSQTGFRGRNDDGTEITASWIAALNTNWTQAANSTFRARFQTTLLGASATLTPQLEYNRNGLGWNFVTTGSSVVKAVDSANITDNEDTTEQLAGSLTFNPGDVSEDGLGPANSMSANEDTETEYVLQIVAADVITGDLIQLRITNVGDPSSFTYTIIPTITVGNVPLAPPGGFPNPGGGDMNPYIGGDIWYRASRGQSVIAGTITRVIDSITVDAILFPGVDQWDNCPTRDGHFFAERVIGVADGGGSLDQAHAGPLWEWPS